MTRYELEITKTAERQLRKLEPPARSRMVRAIQALAEEPRPRGSRKLSGYDDVFRIRVGTYRVLYSAEDGRLIVILLKVGHRGDIYR